MAKPATQWVAPSGTDTATNANAGGLLNLETGFLLLLETGFDLLLEDAVLTPMQPISWVRL